MVIHHRNGDITDDCLENLQLLTRAAHNTLHRLAERTIRQCRCCERTDMKGNGLCRYHYEHERHQQRILDPAYRPRRRAWEAARRRR